MLVERTINQNIEVLCFCYFHWIWIDFGSFENVRTRPESLAKPVLVGGRIEHVLALNLPCCNATREKSAFDSDRYSEWRK